MDIKVNFCGISSPNPFWLASGPPTNTMDQVMRAFEAGWGCAVWKTIGVPVVNVSPRLAAITLNDQRMVGLHNIELISDRTLEENLKEIAEVKKEYPDRAVVVSLMGEFRRQTWHELVKRAQDTGCDGLELNLSCPHGLPERGMGSAIGQVPEYTKQITEWVKEVSDIPVIVKLTPNITDIRFPARAAAQGGADGLSAINTIKSIIGVNLDTLQPLPTVEGRSTPGGLSGPAVKPIVLSMITQLARDPALTVPLSGIGGIATWQDAAEFILLGCTTVQVCTAVMHYGYPIVEDMISGLKNYIAEKGFQTPEEMVGLCVPRVTDWGNLDLNHKVVARINENLCLKDDLCFVACRDGGHQAIRYPNNDRIPVVDEEKCVGCNLCSLVCPVEGCIVMEGVNIC